MTTTKSRQFALFNYFFIKVSLTAVAAVIAVVLFLSGTAFGEITMIAPAPSTVVPESHDFAMDEFSDPWDFSQSSDIRQEDLYWISNLNFANGVVSGRTTADDPNFAVHFPGYVDAWPMGRDGMIHPIDTSRYRYLSVRIYSSAATQFQVYWFFDQVWSNYGLATYWLNPGWNNFRIDLASYPSWAGKPVGLRIDPTNASNIDFAVDYIKLHKAPAAENNVTILWDDSAPGGNANLYLDNDADPANGNIGLLATCPSNASNNWIWDSSDWPAGTYYIFANKSGANSAPAGPLEVRSPGLIQVLDPDEKGGEDYATAMTGNPWDMNSLSDLYISLNIQNLSANGVLSGSLLNDDPNFYLRVGPPIDTNRYHRVNFSMAYDGIFDFGLGSMSRFIWNPDGLNVNLYQTSDDITAYNKWTEYTFDLETMKLDAGLIGWNGYMTTFRFDPLEAFPPRNFWIDYIYLRADDEATTNFPIKWRDLRSSPPPTTVSIYYDTDNKGYDGTLITQNIPQAGGVNTYNWNVTQVESRLYYIYIVASDGVSTGRQYSTGPVRVTTPPVPRWYIRKAVQGGFESQSYWGAPWGDKGDLPLVGDFNGDSFEDIALYRPSNSGWYVRRSTGTDFGGATSWGSTWGNPGTERPLVGDFDGDGKSDIGIYRTGSYPNWFFKLSNGSGFDTRSFALSWGNPGGDAPIVGDFNGDGTDDIGVYRTGSYPNWFFLRTKSDGTGFMTPSNTWNLSWGNPGGDIPITGDFSGDGMADIGVFRVNSYPNWFTNNANGSGFDRQSDSVSSWGNPSTDRPITGDFTGDGMEDIGVFRRP